MTPERACQLLREAYALGNSSFVTDDELKEYLQDGFASAAQKVEDKLGMSKVDQ